MRLCFVILLPSPPSLPLFPYSTLFRSLASSSFVVIAVGSPPITGPRRFLPTPSPSTSRSEEHTSELQSRGHLVCRLLLEKKNTVERTRKDYQSTDYQGVSAYDTARRGL